MTAALPAATVAALARAARDVAEYASDMEMWATTHDRDVVVNAVAIQLLEEHGGSPTARTTLAYLAAEAIAQLVPPVTLPPAADDIRHASNFPGFGADGGAGR